ncbi:UNVERIFIED_CONTAM: hypothetical protein FKN15_038454 [Acipenser sinensis]
MTKTVLRHHRYGHYSNDHYSDCPKQRYDITAPDITAMTKTALRHHRAELQFLEDSVNFTIASLIRDSDTRRSQRRILKQNPTSRIST